MTSPVSADACEVKRTSATRFRTSYGTQMNQPDSFFSSDENPPFVYIDVDTDNCTSSDQINLRIWGITAVSTGGGLFSDFDIPGQIFGSQGVFDYPIDLANQNIDSEGRFTITLKAGTELCTVFNDPYDCLIMAAFLNQNSTSILAILGNALGNLSQADADFFLSTFANLQGVVPSGNTGGECLSQGTDSGYYFQESLACSGLFPFNGYSNSYFGSSFDNLLLSYYNNYPGLNYQFSPDTESGESEFRIALPGIRFNCPGGFGDIECESSLWSVPVGAIIPYGESHSNDQGSVVTSPLSDIYQEDYVPLAPLPFEGLSGGPTPTLGEYLASIFRMSLVVVVILAVLMIVFHGIALTVTASAGKKSDHKDGVKNAIFGLLLAMGSWLLLNTISPNLASNLSINIPNVTLEGDAESISTSPVNTSSGTITGLTLPSDMGLFCPLSGGSSSVPSIIDSFNNKVTYRWGGKGSDLPSGSSFPLSPNESNNGQYMCTNNGQSVPCRNFCPDNSVCLDCSGFVNHVRKCAGLSIYSGTSSMTQSQDAIAVDMSTLSSNGQTLTINGSPYNLQSGDILVWNGHVVVYYGNGIIAESKGDISSIKNPNQNIKKTNLAQSSYRNKITHLIKVNP